MCQHKAPHREWEPNLKYLGHDNDRGYAEPATLFDDYAGRGLAERDQDMTIAKTITPRDMKLTPPPQLTPEQLKQWNAYYEPRNAAYREANPQGADLVRWRYNRYMHDYLGCVLSVDESVGRILKYLDETGLADNTIVVYAPRIRAFIWANMAGSTSAGSSRNRCERRYWCDGRAWPRPGLVSRDIVSNLDFAETFP